MFRDTNVTKIYNTNISLIIKVYNILGFAKEQG